MSETTTVIIREGDSRAPGWHGKFAIGQQVERFGRDDRDFVCGDGEVGTVETSRVVAGPGPRLIEYIIRFNRGPSVPLPETYSPNNFQRREI